MTEANSNTLLVELFLSNGRVHGLTHEVHDRRRLVDVLTEPGPVFTLEAAKVLLGSSSSAREFPSLNVEKRAILAAIPHETQQQQRQRTMLTTMVGKSQTRAIQATLLLPPFIAEGSVHVPQSVGGIGSKLTADAQLFPRFISVTGATLILPGGTEVQSGVLLVNRDLIAGISAVEEKRHPAAYTFQSTA
jgi:hypothetical protein